MCDFRSPPKRVKNLETGEIKDVEYLGSTSDKYCLDGSLLIKFNWDDVKEGFYYVSATGAYYSYFDGESWYRDGNKYAFLDYGLDRGFFGCLLH